MSLRDRTRLTQSAEQPPSSANNLSLPAPVNRNPIPITSSRRNDNLAVAVAATTISTAVAVPTANTRTRRRTSNARKRGAEEAMLNSTPGGARSTRARTPDDNNAQSTPPSGGASSDKVARRYRPVERLDAAILHQFDDPSYKRLRSSADSDAGSSSCKDMDEPEVYAPDSIPALIDQLRKLIYYVESKPALHNGSASFMRDYLRTMLLENSVMAKDVIAAAAKAHKKDVISGRKPPAEHFKHIPEELAKHIFSFLDGENLAKTREVCRKWNEFASEEPLWKALCLKKWKSLETDEHLWRLISRNIPRDAPNRWRKIYPFVESSPQWKCRLQKTGKFICNLIAHQISGTEMGDVGLPSILIVERRFNILHLQTFVLPDAAVLYFEPQSESDREGFNDFIEYLTRRTRAGLALEDQRRFIFIPPCEYTRSQVEYHGESLLGVVQNAYPPLAP